MLQSEAMRTTTSVNYNHSDRLENLSMENGQCSFLDSSTQYKRRKISAVRDFPAGCGRYAQCVSLRPTEAAETALTNTFENLIFKDGMGDHLGNGTSDLLSNLSQVVAARKEDIISDLLDNKFLLPANEHIAVSHSNDLKKRVFRKYPPQSRVSAIREFPPFCGRNSLLCREESLEVLSSPKNRSAGVEKSECEMIDETSTEAVKVDVRQTVGDALDGDLYKIKLERDSSEVNGDSLQPNESVELLVSPKDKFFGQEKCEPNVDDTPLTRAVKGEVKQTLGDVPPMESLEVPASLRNKNCDQEMSRPGMNNKLSREMVNVDLKQTVEDILAGDSYKNELEFNDAKVKSDKLQRECDENAIEDDNVILSELKMDQEERENYNEPPFEDELFWWDHEFETVVGKDNNDVEGSEEHVGKEIVVYSEKKSPDEKHSVTSDFQNQSQVADVGSLEVASNRVVLHGLLGPANPLSQETSASKSKLIAGMSESKEKKHDVTNVVKRQKTKVTARKKVDENIMKGISLKKIPQETASQNAGQLVILGKEDSLQDNEHKDPHVVSKSRGSDVSIFPTCLVGSSSEGHDNSAIVAQHKVRETLHLFQGVYRKFLQEEDAKLKGGQACKRVECKASNFLKEKNKYINTHKILGAVLGVETVVGKDDDAQGSEENVDKEIVLYSKEKGPDKKHSATSDFQNRLQVQHFGSMELASNRVIGNSLLAPSNCLRQKMGARKSKLTVGMSKSKVKKYDVTNLVRRQKTKMAARKKVDEKIIEGISVKNISSETASQSAGQLVIWDKEVSVRHNESKDPHVVPKSRGNDVFIFPFRVDSSSKGHNSNAIDARHKVRETLRLFQGVYRMFLREEEAKLKGGQACKRIDCKAANFLKENNKYINTHKILGDVPGVEVGDEFQFRLELHIIGLHRPVQSGIDFMRARGKVLATSVVASGGYADDLNYSDVLIYVGQGGNVMNSCKEPEDQKLERGNLALKNSMHEKNPVRVIRGYELSDGKSEGKASRTYIYDGLYLVEKFWQDMGPHGKLVFKFQLERIPGQPELAWKEVKKVKKYNVQDGVCVDDISKGKEVIPIRAVNTIDDEKPPRFKYITTLLYPDWCKPTPLEGCNCTSQCSASAKCSCVVKNGGVIPFNHNGAIVEMKPLVYECGPLCGCPPSCPNRVSQHGIKFQLEIFKTKERGWGMRSLNFIPSGSFICEYLGEFLSAKEAEARTANDEYLFDIGNNYNDKTLWGEPLTQMPSSVEDGEGFTINAAEYGNVGRFINHSCTPNLYAQNVLYDHEDKRIPHIMLFAVENIRPLEELTFHYNYVVDQVRDSNGNIKKKSCFCGSHECTGRLY